MVRPDKVDKLLAKKPTTQGWYQREENLASNGLIGPFNFAHIDNKAHRIDSKHWEALLILSLEHKVEASNINQIVPLD